MPRNEAADRYSPEMAAAFSAGGTSRAATATVSSVTIAMAATAGRLIMKPPADRVNQVDEARLQLPGLAVVEPANGHEHREDPSSQDDQREGEARHRYLAGAWQQGHDHRHRRDHRCRQRQAHQGQAKLRPGQRPDQQTAIYGVALNVPDADHVMLEPCLVMLPDHNLPAGRAPISGRRQCRRPARSSRSRTSRAWRRLTGSHRPETLTLWLFPATANSAIWPMGTR